MGEERLRLGRLIEFAVGAAALITIAIGGWYVWRTFVVPHTPSEQSDGRIVSEIVNAKLDAMNDLRVSKLTGSVQGVACVDRLWGVLHPCRVFKAPFEVDYFVPLGDLSLSDFRWNKDTHVLMIRAPAVSPGSVAIDESRTTYENITGIWVSSGAFTELRKEGSILANKVVSDGAREPSRLEQVRRNAKNAIKSQFMLPLKAANVSARIEISFPDERNEDRESWDLSTPLADILSH